MFKIFSVQSLESDHPSLSELKARLETLGYQLISHQANQEVLEEIKSANPDLVLMDPTLPEQHGFKVCESLKNDPETESIPVIFVHTRPNGNGMLVKSFESGATDFVSIEAGETEVLARLQAAIRHKQTVSQAVALAHELNKMNTELYERNLQVEKELYVTRQLQQSLLPPFLPDENKSDAAGESVGSSFTKCHYKDERVKISGVYLPCDALGGDLYDVIKFANGTVGVAIADVSGHGVPAGFITAIFKSSLYRITHSHKTPSDILFHLNNELADMVKTGEYVTAVYSCITLDEDDPSRLVLDYSGAGHPYPYHYKASEDQAIRLTENGTPLVWIKNMQYPMGRISLETGDKLLMFTDGITEMRNTHGNLYGEEALEELFLKLVRNQSDNILDEMIQVLSDYTEGHPLEDDLSMVLIEVF
jgi:phosphoserine phosphatase RsbU/P